MTEKQKQQKAAKLTDRSRRVIQRLALFHEAHRVGCVATSNELKGLSK